ncbi:UDP-GlcNAc:betaGal beta-1,3-N-acetylglucosaminyltransferase-like protein 1 [Galemys pyrenaicus]|uniref:UDP-GlcNAc:betaGal beta-1,3-N-acetylglucosaminyltransferase-like protein 1 n=1 Tax=Galemys pyrenaicus TaxID=202257 RepID=A0A8J6DGF9_GALPY|nr:UDP-GlcNAc:betaGal beta-1,3-N-acetylglucosaminyltransferase-like protein 1 [Galemys pyrenaicus]
MHFLKRIFQESLRRPVPRNPSQKPPGAPSQQWAPIPVGEHIYWGGCTPPPRLPAVAAALHPARLLHQPFRASGWVSATACSPGTETLGTLEQTSCGLCTRTSELGGSLVLGCRLPPRNVALSPGTHKAAGVRPLPALMPTSPLLPPRDFSFSKEPKDQFGDIYDLIKLKAALRHPLWAEGGLWPRAPGAGGHRRGGLPLGLLEGCWECGALEPSRYHTHRYLCPAFQSVILPVHDAAPWLDECLRSVLQQDFQGPLELSAFDDASKDGSLAILEDWKAKLEDAGIRVVIGGHDSPSPRGGGSWAPCPAQGGHCFLPCPGRGSGALRLLLAQGCQAWTPFFVGYSRNRAIEQSSGPFLCFLDSGHRQSGASRLARAGTGDEEGGRPASCLGCVCPVSRPELCVTPAGRLPLGRLAPVALLGCEDGVLLQDDVMMPQRVRLQLEVAMQHPSSAGDTGSASRLGPRSPLPRAVMAVTGRAGMQPCGRGLGGQGPGRWAGTAVLVSPQVVGCQVSRDPPDSTERYTRWINQLSPEQLLTQVFTSNGPTVVMPTWFCSRAWFSHVGPFDEGGRVSVGACGCRGEGAARVTSPVLLPELGRQGCGVRPPAVDTPGRRRGGRDLGAGRQRLTPCAPQGVPEDLLFFYEHLRKGGGLARVDQSLLLYRYHPRAATHSVLEATIWSHRVRFLEERALPRWEAFTIWNAGKQGRRLYRSLTAEARSKVVAFCDVDEKKIRKGFYSYEDSQDRPKPRVPILHFRAARLPFVICVKLDLTGGVFEDNLRSLRLQEGRDFLHFS